MSLKKEPFPVTSWNSPAGRASMDSNGVADDGGFDAYWKNMELLDLNEAEIPLDKLEYGPESVGENSNSYLFSPEGSSSLKNKNKPKKISDPSNTTALWSPLDKATASYSASFEDSEGVADVHDEGAQYRSPGPKRAPRLQAAAFGAHAVSDGEDEEDDYEYDDYADDDNVRLGESGDVYEEGDPFEEDDDDEGLENYHKHPSPEKGTTYKDSHSSPSKAKSQYSASQVLQLVDAELHRLQRSHEKKSEESSEGEEDQDDESSESIVGRDVFPEDSFADDGAEPVFTYRDFEFLPPKDAGDDSRSRRHVQESGAAELTRKHRSRHGSGASSNPSQRGDRSGGGAPRAGRKKGPYAKENLVPPPQMRKRRPGESVDPAVKQAIKEKTARQKAIFAAVAQRRREEEEEAALQAEKEERRRRKHKEALLQKALKKRESVRGDGPHTERSTPDKATYGASRGLDESDESSCTEEAARVVQRAEAKQLRTPHHPEGKRIRPAHDGGDQEATAEEDDHEEGSGSRRLQQKPPKKSPSSKLLEPTRAYEAQKRPGRRYESIEDKGEPDEQKSAEIAQIRRKFKEQHKAILQNLLSKKKEAELKKKEEEQSKLQRMLAMKAKWEEQLNRKGIVPSVTAAMARGANAPASAVPGEEAEEATYIDKAHATSVVEGKAAGSGMAAVRLRSQGSSTALLKHSGDVTGQENAKPQTSSPKAPRRRPRVRSAHADSSGVSGDEVVAAKARPPRRIRSAEYQGAERDKSVPDHLTTRGAKTADDGGGGLTCEGGGGDEAGDAAGMRPNKDATRPPRRPRRIGFETSNASDAGTMNADVDAPGLDHNLECLDRDLEQANMERREARHQANGGGGAASSARAKLDAHLAALAQQRRQAQEEEARKQERLKRRMEKLSQRVVQEALERRGQSGVSGPIDSEGGASDQENGALSKPKKRVTPEAAEALVARLQARAQRTADGIALMANAPPPARDFVDWKRKHNLELDCPVFCMTGWYPCVKDALIQRGWFYNPDALSPFFDLKWTLRSSDIGLDSLQPWQLTNHFLKNIAITTKAGLIKCLQQLVWHADVCPDDIIPRAYDLSSLLELHAFVADFRYQKAQNVLKTLYFRISGSKGPLYKRDAKSRSNRTQSGSGHSFDQGDDTDNPNKKSDVSPRDAELSKMMEGGFGKLDFERPGSSRGGDMAGRPLTASSIADSIPLPPPSGASPESFMVNKAVFEVACDVLERYLRPQEDSYLDAPEEDADDIPMTPLEWEVLVYHAIDAPSRSGLAASAPELLGPFGNTLEEEEGGAGHSLRDSRAASTKYNGSLHRSRKKQKRNDAAARAAMNDAVKQMVPLTNQGYQRIHRLLCRLYVLEGNQAGLNGNCASSQNLWIVKPAAKSRGRGITTFSDLDKLLTYVDAAQTGQGSGSGGASMWIVQKYMENPLIIANRKFDLRQWVLVTDWNPLTIYFFDECYARFSVEEYSTDSASLENAFVHLVNNSIGKNSDKFGVTVTAENGEPISGYMWDFNQFKDYVKFRSGGVDYVTEKIHPRMKEIAKWSLSCAVDMIEHRKNSWELYGFDFMVDDNYNAWLIEINSSPACDYSTKTTERYVQKALVELLAVTLDVRKWEAAPRKDRGERPDTGGWECIYKGPLLETAASSFGMDMTIKGSGVKLPRRGPAFVGASQSHSIAPASDKAGAASSPGRESSGAGAAARSEPTRTTAPRPILRHASTGPLASAKMGTFSGDAAPLDIDGGNDDNMGATRSAHSKNKRLTTSDVMPAASGDGAADRNEFDDSDEDELGDIGSKRLAGRIAKTRSSGMSDRSARQTPSASTTTAAAVASSRAGGASLSGTTTSHTTAAAAAGNPHTKRGEVAIPVKVFSVDF